MVTIAITIFISFCVYKIVKKVYTVEGYDERVEKIRIWIHLMQDALAHRKHSES